MSGNDLSHLSREQLARLGREYMAAAQFNSRTGYAALRINHGDESYKTAAIDNWMAASPIYTRRMQKAMGFSGSDDVATIFKGLQLECGFAHQYFDVHFEVFSEASGRFWLASCGPLLETEPRGDEAVKVMCHDVEDPTFDATAIATNPQARVRPVHRPPRVPADRVPHCEWNVIVDSSAESLGEPEVAKKLQKCRLAQLNIPRPRRDNEPGGMFDYSGELVEQLHLEQLSHSALVVVCKELALQVNLLVKAMTMVIEDLYGRDAARAVAEFQMTGSAWVVANRLARWAGYGSGGIDAVIAVLGVHPVFQPQEYQDIRIEKLSDNSASIELNSSPALEDNAFIGVINLLEMGFTEGLDALVKGVDAGARCTQPDPGKNKWLVEIVSGSEQPEDPLPVQIAKGTVLYQTQFENRIQLLQLES